MLTPRIRKSPYFDATLRYGAKSFLAYNNMYLPMGYDTVLADGGSSMSWCASS